MAENKFKNQAGKQSKWWVAFDEVKRVVSIEMVLKHYGFWDKFRKSGQNMVSWCPIHKGSNPRQFSVSLEKNIWHCFGDCNGGGDVIDFVAKMEDLSGRNTNDVRRRAALLLKNWFLGGSVESADSQSSKGKAEGHGQGKRENCLGKKDKDKNMREDRSEDRGVQMSDGQHKDKDKAIQGDKVSRESKASFDQMINPPLGFKLKNLNPDHPFFNERGFSPETVKFFEAGYCSKGMMSGYIAFPIYNNLGEVVAYCGRALTPKQVEEEGKYKLPGDFKKSFVVYNLHRQIKGKIDCLILVESPLSVWWLSQAGFSNVVSLLGSSLSEYQEGLICEFLGPGGRVVLLFDSDESGRQCISDCVSRLSFRLFIRVVNVGLCGVKKPHQLDSEGLKKTLGFLSCYEIMR